MFDLAVLDAALKDTIFAGKLHFSPVTGSTNTDALAAARSAAPHSSVYFAEEQLAGRGRGDHAWHSASGEGLYVSVLLRSPIPSIRLPLVPLATGLAAADAIHAVAGLTVDLRWPNDLLLSTPRTETSPFTPASKDRSPGAPKPWGPWVGPRKAGGILVETHTEGSKVAYAVIGIGINVHQRHFAPDLSPQRRRPVAGGPDLATPATSLDLEAGCRVSRQDLLVVLLKSLEREMLELLEPSANETIPARVERASTWVRGRQVVVHGPQACTGVTAGLDERGFLLVHTAGGLVTVQTGGMRAVEIG